MGASCPHCQRITTATKSGFFTCIGCGRVFRVGPCVQVKIGLRVRISRLEAVRDEIAGVEDPWLAMESCILDRELAMLRELLEW